jgi:hypothetical protein
MTDEAGESPMDRYELSRRDALVALGAAGVGVGGLGALRFAGDTDGTAVTDRRRATIVAVAETLYPSEVDGIPAFVESYVLGRIEDRPDYAAGMMAAADHVDEYAQTWNETSFANASGARRDELLRGMGVDVLSPDPDGSDEERVRYYLINDLQYALYSSPVGGNLVGIENPQGHPGGISSYQQPPE